MYKRVPVLKLVLGYGRNKEEVGFQFTPIWEENLLFTQGDTTEQIIREAFDVAPKHLKFDTEDLIEFDKGDGMKPLVSKPLYFSEVPDFVKRNFNDTSKDMYKALDAKNEEPYLVFLMYKGDALMKFPDFGLKA